MKINIGAGNTRVDGYIRIDYDANSEPDYCIDIEKEKLPFEDSVVDTVVAHHILEHLGEGYFHVLKEIYRVCKHNAVIDIRVPHPRHDAFLADPTHKRPITPLGLQLFSRSFNDYCKKNELSASLLGEYFGVNFEILSWEYIPEEKYKQILSGKSQEYIDEFVNERNNIIREYHIRLVVIKE